MKIKKIKRILALTVALALMVVTLVGCMPKDDVSWKTNELFDTMFPSFEGSGIGEANANSDGWYEVFTDDFNGNELNYGLEKYNLPNNEIWTTSPHAMRWETQKKGKDNYTSYWCPDMVKVEAGNCVITSIETTTHKCSSGVCPSVGRFTGGIETRAVVNSNDNKGTADDILFSQAFGYFETRVQLPKSDGLWSAFWLQSSNMRKVGNEGLDGTEIDIYESAFLKSNKDGKSSYMGNAMLWDGYGKSAKVADNITKVNKDLYDGYHTFGLKWTPLYYVFYIDGEAIWASRDGGVAKVAEFLRLTVEMDAGDGYGPHGMKIGQYSNKNSLPFFIDYVKVYQNKNYTPFVISDSQFDGVFDKAN